MKKFLLAVFTRLLDCISLIICAPGALLILIGGAIADWSESLKHIIE